MSILRDVAQLIVEKLDRNHVTVKEAKEHAARYGLQVKGRTREQVAREVSRAAAPAHYEEAITGMDQRLQQQINTAYMAGKLAANRGESAPRVEYQDADLLRAWRRGHRDAKSSGR